jgi:hypothetical protein
MIYQVELEVDDDKISFAEEFFRSISFVRKVKKIVPENKHDEFIPEKSLQENRKIGLLDGKVKIVFSDD